MLKIASISGIFFGTQGKLPGNPAWIVVGFEVM